MGKEGRKEVMGFVLRQDAAEHRRWLLLAQRSPGPTMEPGGRQSPWGQGMGTTTSGSKTSQRQAGRSQKLGVTPGNKSGGQQQLPRARIRAGQHRGEAQSPHLLRSPSRGLPKNLQGRCRRYQHLLETLWGLVMVACFPR